MDRRGFLKVLGIGGAAVVATPQLVLAATTKVAVPERRVFVPPTVGWPALGEDDSPFVYTSRRVIPGTDTLYVDIASEPRWTLDLERYDTGGGLQPSFKKIRIGGVEGWLAAWDETILTNDAVRIHERYVGTGRPPDIHSMSKIAARIKVEYPSDRVWIP